MRESFGFRDYGIGLIVAQSNPFKVGLFEGGIKEMMSLFLSGNDLSAVRKTLSNKYPEYISEIGYDIQVVESFCGCNEELDKQINSINDFNASLSDINKFARKHKLLTTATIELNTLCNLHCKHCYHKNIRVNGLGFDVIKKLLKDLKEIGVLFVCLTGGEIFLRDDILDIIDLLDKYHFITEIKTNGTLLSKKHISGMQNKKISDIQISIYELEDGWSEFTKAAYSFTLILENIKLLRKSKIPVSVSYQVTQKNINTIDHAYKVLSELVDDFTFYHYITPNLSEPINNLDLRLSFDQIKNILYPKLKSWGMLSAPQKYRSKGRDHVCYAGYEQIFIDAEGVVYPCQDLKIKIGDLNTHNIYEITSNRFDIINKIIPKEIPLCNNCEYYEYCDSCIGVALQENESVFIPSKHKCDLA